MQQAEMNSFLNDEQTLLKKKDLILQIVILL